MDCPPPPPPSVEIPSGTLMGGMDMYFWSIAWSAPAADGMGRKKLGSSGNGMDCPPPPPPSVEIPSGGACGGGAANDIPRVAAGAGAGDGATPPPPPPGANAARAAFISVCTPATFLSGAGAPPPCAPPGPMGNPPPNRSICAAVPGMDAMVPSNPPGPVPISSASMPASGPADGGGNPPPAPGPPPSPRGMGGLIIPARATLARPARGSSPDRMSPAAPSMPAPPAHPARPSALAMSGAPRITASRMPGAAEVNWPPSPPGSSWAMCGSSASTPRPAMPEIASDCWSTSWSPSCDTAGMVPAMAAPPARSGWPAIHPGLSGLRSARPAAP